ncbi:MAG: hypothetical protein JSW25_08305 [Thermoplasmata archaeon]|nr:MAG: hypothetical protein JSW25_08305 [Thermoplasmata archaeon]
MARGPSRVWIVAIVLVAAFWATVYILAYLQVDEPGPDEFRMTLMVSGSEANATDGNLTDVVVWVAVANGEPKPRWTGVEVTLETPSGSEVMAPPRLRIEDQDGNGRVSEGDLLTLYALDAEEASGTVILSTEDGPIGTVRL